MAIDRERAQVYAAERAAFEGTTIEEIIPFPEVVAAADRLTSSSTWPMGRIKVVAARSDASTSTTVWRPPDPPTVRITRPQQTLGTLVHEMAHVLAGRDAGHGAQFRRAHLDITSALLGDDAAGWLEEAYRAHRLDIGERCWPRCTLGIAL